MTFNVIDVTSNPQFNLVIMHHIYFSIYACLFVCIYLFSFCENELKK